MRGKEGVYESYLAGFFLCNLHAREDGAEDLTRSIMAARVNLVIFHVSTLVDSFRLDLLDQIKFDLNYKNLYKLGSCTSQLSCLRKIMRAGRNSRADAVPSLPAETSSTIPHVSQHYPSLCSRS